MTSLKSFQNQFLTSSVWKEFQAGLGYPIKQIGDLVLISKPLVGGGHYWYLPRGKSLSSADWQTILTELKKDRSWFIRFEPITKAELETRFKQRLVKTINIQPAKTLILDLSFSAEKILAAMNQKARYNLHLAEKKGVRVFCDNQRIDDFLELMGQTTKRDNFSGHSANYYRALAECQPEFIKLYLAEYEGRIIAAGLFAFYQGVATYLHGASSNQDRPVMAPYLLQWTVIKAAQDRGYHYYDFYGIDEIKWPGVTRFKLGFGGQVIEYPGTYDYVLNRPAYFIYKLLRRLRRVL